MFDRTNFSYSLNDFDDDEKDAVLESKQEAVKKFSNLDTVTKLGTGSGGKTIVYKTGDYAVKLFCGITKNCGNKNLDDEMSALSRIASTRFDIGINFFHEIGNAAKLRSVNSIQGTDSGNRPVNLIFFTAKSDILPWKCSRFNRVGVDYAFQMPFVKCLANELKTYHLQKQGSPKEQPEDLEKILAIGIDLCDALIVMHKNSIIHQDIKPQNIFLDHDNYCLGDLGIAREEDNRQYFLEGTPAYWSPEQGNGQVVDHRCDIYSLGLVLYELADTVPMSAHYEERMHIDKKLPELKTDVPEGLKMILQNACEYEPSLRYQSAETFKNDLCQLKKNTGYKPKSTRDIYKPGNSLPLSFNSNLSPSRNQAPRSSHGGAGDFHMRQRANRFFQPENLWRAGKLWYEESRKTGSRFAELKIDEKIMPLSSNSSHAADFPIRVSESTEGATKQKPLSDILKDTENLHNMYLIGEGGIGKTTALNSIMKLKYEKKEFYVSKNGKTVIPLFIELSKAPSDYCNAYYASHSTFIQRYLYMLLASVQKQHLLSESPKEMAQIMDKQDTSITDNIDMLLNMDEDHTQYLLLLDGLNEVSKKQLSTKEKDFLGTPSELLVEEIKELLEKHKNITAIITSRADETLSDLDDSFERLYLTGVSEDDIKEYLDSCKISSEQVSKNSRLMETLRIPLFLKLYGELYNTADISTPGEILYAFFSERSTKYTARNRIAEIKQDHQKAGDAYGSNSLDEKMQWFILDFLLPELGWYMEKNDLYTVDLPTFQQIIDTVLKGENETDICGTYGRKYFKEYLKGEDPIPNTQTYARLLLALGGPLDEDYASVIAKYCVYSLGILYVNNQSYSFIHQHIRDFFCAMKIITDMKMALYVAEGGSILENHDENDNTKRTALRILNTIGADYFDEKVSLFIGEILGEYKNTFQLIDGKWQIYVQEEKRLLLTRILSLYRRNFSRKSTISIAVHNLLDIFEKSHGNLNHMDLSELDLSRCNFNGIPLEEASLNGALVTKQTFFPNGHDSSITCIRISPCGEHFLTGDSNGIVKLWRLKTRKYIRTIIDCKYLINNIQYVHDGKELLISTIAGAWIYDTHHYEIKKKYFNTYFALSDNNAKKIILANNSILKKAEKTILGHNTVFKNKVNIQLFDRASNRRTKLEQVREDFCADLISFSPDGKYIVLINTQNQLVIFEYDSAKIVAKFELIALGLYDKKGKPDYEVCLETTKDLSIIKEHVYVSLCFDSTGKYLAIANNCDIKIFEFSKLLMRYAALAKYPVLGSVKKARDIGHILYECLVWQKLMLDNEVVTSIKFINNNSFLSVTFLNQTVCLYDFKRYPHGNDLKIGSLLSTITCMDASFVKGIPLLITCDVESNILIWHFKGSKSIASTYNIVPIYNNSLKTIDTITGTANLLYISSKQEGRMCYDAVLNKIRIYPQKNKESYNYSVFSHSQKMCAIGMENGNVCIRSPFTHLNKGVKVSDKRVLYMEFSPNDKLLLVSLHDDSPKIIEIDTDTVSTLPTFQNKSDKAIFSEDGKFIFCCNGNFIEKFSSETYERINYVKEYCEPYLENLANRTLNRFKKNINQYNPLTTIIASPEYTYHQYNSKVTAISCSPDQLYLAIAWSRGEVEIREKETLSCIAILESNNRNVKTISFGRTHMAIPFGKSSVKIYDTRTWNCVSILHGFPSGVDKDVENLGHSDLVTSILFDNDIENITKQEKIITASKDGTIKYWNAFLSERMASTVSNLKYRKKIKKVLSMLWKKFDLIVGVILGDEGTTVNCKDICECEKTLYFVPGLDVDGSTLQNLNPASNLTQKDLDILKLYGAKTE